MKSREERRMRMNGCVRRTFCGLGLLALLGLPLAASAETGNAVPARAAAVASAHVRDGKAALSRGDYEAAREEFVQAQALDPHASVLRDLATSELHSGRPLDAYKHLRAFIADASTGADDRATAQISASEAYFLTGHLLHRRASVRPR